MMNFVIVGTGPAGIAAAQAIRQQEHNARITLIGDEPQGFYSRPGLAYLLTGEIPERGLYPFKQEDFKRWNLRILNARVRTVQPLNHRIELHTGDELTYDRLLWAVGARAVGLEISQAGLDGQFVLDTLHDAQMVLKSARKARSSVVVGGGITALEIAEGLNARGVRTHYFLRKDRYWSNVLDPVESRIIEQRLQEEGIQIHYHTELAEIKGEEGKVVGVLTAKGETIRCQMVGVAVGIRPRLALARTAGLKYDRGILVNEYLQTNEPNIFAAGDVSQVYDPRTGVSVIDSLWGPARKQGQAAGLNMVGIATPYSKGLAFNVTRLAGLTTTIIGGVGRGSDADLVGIARGDSETWRFLPDAIAAQTDFGINRLRIMVGEKHLVGAVVMGDQTLSQPLYHLIALEADITPIRDKMLASSAGLEDLMIRFWSEWRAKHGI